MNAGNAITYPGAIGRRSNPQPYVSIWLAGAAAALGAVIVVAAAVVPIVTLQSPPAAATVVAGNGPLPAPSAAPVMRAQPRVTLLAHDGVPALGLAAIPLVVALGVGLLLWHAIRRASRPARSAAWALTTLLALAGVVGFVTILIGVVVLPVAGLLIGACTNSALRELA